MDVIIRVKPCKCEILRPRENEVEHKLLRWLSSFYTVAHDNTFVHPILLLYSVCDDTWLYHIFNFSGWKSGKTRTPLKNVPCSDLSFSFWKIIIHKKKFRMDTCVRCHHL